MGVGAAVTQSCAAAELLVITLRAIELRRARPLPIWADAVELADTAAQAVRDSFAEQLHLSCGPVQGKGLELRRRTGETHRARSVDHAGDAARAVSVGDRWHDDRVSHRRAVLGVGAFVLTFAALAVTALVIERIGPAPAPVQGPAAKPRLFACNVPQGADAGYCARVAKDDGWRAAVTDEARADLSAVVGRIDDLLNPEPTCRAVQETPGGPARRQCDRVLPDPAVLLARLADAGFTGAVVRPARDGDPAPQDSLFYAVPVRGVCVVGAVTGLPERIGGRVAGTLATGGCD
ncbi:hypothetical protein AB0J72_18725 [Dactylosporangium sp. NPDC049742]|uniref:hypothetical protein n=1 Tax=Dactylosporangium sp. NPDC049742 TaxID=3154737 RepID=UPI00343C7150